MYMDQCKLTQMESHHILHSKWDYGTAERKNRTIMNMVRCMLKGKHQPKELWGEVVSTTTYTLNRCPTKRLKGITPEECWSGHKSSVNHMIVFGSVAYKHTSDQFRKKLDDKSTTMILVGYHSTGGYKLYDPINKNVVISRDVVIDELKEWDWNTNEKRNSVSVMIEEISEEQESQPVSETQSKIGAKGFVQKEGIDYDEVFAHVTRMETIRPIDEEVYVAQPPGYEVKGQESKVYKLKKALYGLKQAPRAWNKRIDKFINEIGFVKCITKQGVYVKKDAAKGIIVICLYVDDLLITGSNESYISEFKKPRLQLTKCTDEEDIDPTFYRKLIGSLRYLCNTRLDLAYSVGIVSRFMERPKSSHLIEVKRLLRYVKGTIYYGIVFPASDRKKECKLVSYTYSNWCGDHEDIKSTAGYMFFYGGAPISWCSKKEPVVALSSCEAEYIAASLSTCQAIWLMNLIKEISQDKREAVILKIDNVSDINLAKNPIAHGRSKHIELRFHYLREQVNNGNLALIHCRSEEQVAELLTKAVIVQVFEKLRSEMGIETVDNMN
ncbi:cationic amino acid transporter 1-like protein [Trifolium pratense]|uniref:Cationic amino acid transporter 1-like protein n=1 Tax=Trifolium pratense TaxID=57577 RepID=A0A2K3N328_TRIPR|nr:cationic amino acid transporter 1-like protein [Trifolium pratense]